jgi:SAM-dependent methyltransferase
MKSWLLLLLVACTTTKPAVERKGEAMFGKSDNYERFMGRWSRLLAPQLVAFAGVKDGDNILDVGSGTGVLAFAIRDATTKGEIVGIDPSEDYVEFAREHEHEARITFSVGDGQALSFADNRFDKTLSLLVVNFIPDRDKAVTEMIRVTKPGGVVAAAVWDYGDGMEMLRVFWSEAVALDGDAPDEKQLPLTKDGELAAKWKEHGLVNVEQKALIADQQFASFDDFWQPFTLGQGPAGAYVAKLPADRRAALEARLRKRLLGDGPDRPFELHSRAWAVTGTVAK